MLQLDAVGLLGHLSQGVGGAVDMGVAPLFAGPYKLRFSLWGLTWNKGRIEPAPSLQYATVWATPDISNTLSKSVGVMTAPSLEPHEQEITTWLEPRELLVFDPVSVHSRFLGDHKQEMVEVYVKLVGSEKGSEKGDAALFRLRMKRVPMQARRANQGIRDG